MAMPTFSMRDLLETGVHFGHHTRRWDPRMKSYIFGVRNNIHILDLQQTVPLLHRALQAVRDTVARGGGVVRRHQAAGRRNHCRNGHPVRPIFRQSPLAWRHADQLENHFRVD